MSPAITKMLLTEEEKKARCVVIQRSAMHLDGRNTFDNIGEEELLVARELRDSDLCELVVERRRQRLCDDGVRVCIVLEVRVR